MIKLFETSVILATALLITACGGGEKASTDDTSPGGGTPATSQPPATGKTIVVEMVTDETGNYFTPKEIEAHRGDVIRFTLKAGVHNVNFLPDSNSIKTGLPAPSEMLQLPGQTYDFVVNLQEGDYYFQCDPHAALGMVGKLEVEDED
jgi:plastocyanin